MLHAPAPVSYPLVFSGQTGEIRKTLPERSNAGTVFDRVYRLVLFGILSRNVWDYVVRMFTCGRPLSCRVRLCGFLSFLACPECLGALSRGAGIPCAGCLFAVPSRRVPLSSGTLPKADCNCGSRAVRIVFDPRNTPGLLRYPSKPPSGLFRGIFFRTSSPVENFRTPRRDILLVRLSLPRRSTNGLHRPFAPEELPRTAPFGSRSIRGSARVPVVGTLSVEAGPVVVIRFGGLPFASADSCVVGVYCSKCRDRGCLARRLEGSVSVFRGKALRSRPVCLSRPRNGLSELRIEGLNDISGLS